MLSAKVIMTPCKMFPFIFKAQKPCAICHYISNVQWQIAKIYSFLKNHEMYRQKAQSTQFSKQRYILLKSRSTFGLVVYYNTNLPCGDVFSLYVCVIPQLGTWGFCQLSRSDAISDLNFPKTN